jgi:5-formyltetrahydrofolate cyclo-ligase
LLLWFESNGTYRHLRVTPLFSSAELDAGAPRAVLRRALRQRRAAMPAATRAAAARTILSHIGATSWLSGQRRIGVYVAVGAEVDTRGLRTLARRRHCQVYLPRITDYRARTLLFCREHALERINRFGIGEPAPGSAAALSARWLSVLFLPLLGFDAAGTRLGSGAGYFDRALSFRRHRQFWHRPLLVGLAYDCQQLEHIQPHSHDVPLDAVVSEQGVMLCQPTQRPP